MNNKGFLKMSIAVLTVLTALLLIGCAPPPVLEKPIQSQLMPEYKLERITPQIIRVIAYRFDGGDMVGLGYGYALAEAIKEIDGQYEIKNVTPVTYLISRGSATKELYIVVGPKRY